MSDAPVDYDDAMPDPIAGGPLIKGRRLEPVASEAIGRDARRERALGTSGGRAARAIDLALQNLAAFWRAIAQRKQP